MSNVNMLFFESPDMIYHLMTVYNLYHICQCLRDIRVSTSEILPIANYGLRILGRGYEEQCHRFERQANRVADNVFKQMVELSQLLFSVWCTGESSSRTCYLLSHVKHFENFYFSTFIKFTHFE